MWPFNKIKRLEKELEAIKQEISVTDSQAFSEMFLGGSGATTTVNQSTAMKCSAVFSCVRLISGAVASSPIRLYRETDEGRKRALAHPFSRMLTVAPNDHITAATFWKQMASNKVLNGNAYAVIVRAKSGRPIALIPIRTNRCTPYQAWERQLDRKLNVKPDRLFYEVNWDNGSTSVIDQDDMIHVPNISWDGKQGLSTITAGAQSMGLALSAEESANSLFTGGMLSQVALRYDTKLDPDAQDRLRDHISKKYAGSSNHHTPLILTEGGDVKTISMNSSDAQLVESRAFSVIDVCRFFGVPPVMVGESTKTSSWGSGVEQMARWFVMFTLNDHLTDIEQELEKKLFRNSGYFAKFDESEWTRGDTKTRAEYNKAAVGGTQNPGWLTVNEIRRSENMEPLEGGDALFVPKGEEKNEEELDAAVR